MKEIAKELNLDLNIPAHVKKAKGLIDRFCHNCGKTGGHTGPCHQQCKWCKSTEHNSIAHPECPFWNAWGIISLLYNPYFVRNQRNTYGYLAWEGDLDPKWVMDLNLTLEKNDNNKRIYPQLIRQLEILKFLCGKNDVYFTLEKHIKYMDRICEIFEQNKHDYKVQEILNKKMERFTENNDNITENDIANRCWYCKKEIEYPTKYKTCPKRICNTKYCETCWEPCFKGIPTVKCYICKDTFHRDFKILDNPQIIIENNNDDEDGWESSTSSTSITSLSSESSDTSIVSIYTNEDKSENESDNDKHDKEDNLKNTKQKNQKKNWRKKSKHNKQTKNKKKQNNNNNNKNNNNNNNNKNNKTNNNKFKNKKQMNRKYQIEKQANFDKNKRKKGRTDDCYSLLSNSFIL